jgi:integrase
MGELVRNQNPPLQKTNVKNPRWFIRPYVDRLQPDGSVKRERERIYLGLCDDVDRKSAGVQRAEVLRRINNGSFILQRQINFGEFLDLFEKKFVEAKDNLATSTQAKYAAHLNNHIRPAFGHLAIGELTTLRIDDWLAAKNQAGLSWSTRCDLRNLMSCIFRQAKKWGVWKQDNPAQLATVGRKRMVREKRKLPMEDTRRLLLALPDDVRLIIMAALFCTLRISEVLGLQWRHIDFENGKITVRQRYYRGNLDVPKSQKAVRDVPMGELSRFLAERNPGPESADDFVFTVKTSRGVSRDDRDILQHFLRPTAEKLDLYYPGFGFHSFRREAVTALANEIGVPQTMKAAGHSKADMTLLYTLDDFEKQAAGIRHFQQQVLGSADDPTNPFFISKGTERAKKKGDEEEIVTLCVLNLNGGPVQTRTADLYRVKVENAL